MSKDSPDEKTPEPWIELMWAIAERKTLHDIVPERSVYIFDGYEAYSTIDGGMGMVIIGRDPKLDRNVAIKLWKNSGPEAEAALIAEAKTLAKLSHPNVVTVYSVGNYEGSVYFVMEYIEGENGHDWLKVRRTWQEIRDVFVDAGTGLAAAHDAGIQHGDFKPANILIGADGRTRVADFGVADKIRVVDSDEQRSGRTAGTPGYMAPERLRGERGDARSDQFSFCVSLWRALFGWRPYGGETVFELLEAIESGAIRPGDPLARVPSWLSRAVRKGLAGNPDDRYRDMHELLRALKDEPPDDETAAGEPDDERSVEHEGRRLLHSPAQPDHQWRRVQASLMVLAFAVLGLSFVVTLLWLRPPSSVRQLDSASSVPPSAEPGESAPLREATARSHVGVTPEQVIELVENGDLERAEEMWVDEVRHRSTADVAIYADSIRVGEAYLDRARRLRDEGRVTEARTAAETALKFGLVAVRDLKRYDQPVDVGTELAEQASQFLDDLRERI